MQRACCAETRRESGRERKREKEREYIRNEVLHIGLRHGNDACEFRGKQHLSLSARSLLLLTSTNLNVVCQNTLAAKSVPQRGGKEQGKTQSGGKEKDKAQSHSHKLQHSVVKATADKAVQVLEIVMFE